MTHIHKTPSQTPNILHGTCHWKGRTTPCQLSFTVELMSFKHHSWTPFGICLPGTELLQSPFKTEFSMEMMGSLLWGHWWSLQHHRRFLRSYDPCSVITNPCGIVAIPEPVWIFLFMIKRTLSHICTAIQPISHCVANIWICPPSHQSPQHLKRMEFLVHPVNKGLVPIHYKYFVKNLTASFSVEPCVMEHSLFSKP